MATVIEDSKKNSEKKRERQELIEKYARGREEGAVIDPWEDPRFELYHLADRYGFIHDARAPLVHQQMLADRKLIKTEMERVEKWLKMWRRWPDYVNTDKFRSRIYKGVPDKVRGAVWIELLNIRKYQSQQDGIYETMLNFARQYGDHLRQVDLDVNRTYRDNTMFRDRYSVKQISLFNVLIAYSVYNSEVNYCQGMSQVAALLLMYMNDEDAFWGLSVLLCNPKYAMHGFFVAGFPKLMRFNDYLWHLMKRQVPRLRKHFEKHDLRLDMITVKWFMQCFLDRVPFSLALRLWDIYLYEGERVLIAFSMATFKMHQRVLLRMRSLEEIMDYFQHRLPESYGGITDDDAISELKEMMQLLRHKKIEKPSAAEFATLEPGVLIYTVPAEQQKFERSSTRRRSSTEENGGKLSRSASRELLTVAGTTVRGSTRRGESAARRDSSLANGILPAVVAADDELNDKSATLYDNVRGSGGPLRNSTRRKFIEVEEEEGTIVVDSRRRSRPSTNHPESVPVFDAERNDSTRRSSRKGRSASARRYSAATNEDENILLENGFIVDGADSRQRRSKPPAAVRTTTTTTTSSTDVIVLNDNNNRRSQRTQRRHDGDPVVENDDGAQNYLNLRRGSSDTDITMTRQQPQPVRHGGRHDVRLRRPGEGQEEADEQQNYFNTTTEQREQELFYAETVENDDRAVAPPRRREHALSEIDDDDERMANAEVHRITSSSAENDNEAAAIPPSAKRHVEAPPLGAAGGVTSYVHEIEHEIEEIDVRLPARYVPRGGVRVLPPLPDSGPAVLHQEEEKTPTPANQTVGEELYSNARAAVIEAPAVEVDEEFARQRYMYQQQFHHEQQQLHYPIAPSSSPPPLQAPPVPTQKNVALTADDIINSSMSNMPRKIGAVPPFVPRITKPAATAASSASGALRDEHVYEEEINELITTVEERRTVTRIGGGAASATAGGAGDSVSTTTYPTSVRRDVLVPISTMATIRTNTLPPATSTGGGGGATDPSMERQHSSDTLNSGSVNSITTAAARRRQLPNVPSLDSGTTTISGSQQHPPTSADDAAVQHITRIRISEAAQQQPPPANRRIIPHVISSTTKTSSSSFNRSVIAHNNDDAELSAPYVETNIDEVLPSGDNASTTSTSTNSMDGGGGRPMNSHRQVANYPKQPPPVVAASSYSSDVYSSEEYRENLEQREHKNLVVQQQQQRKPRDDYDYPPVTKVTKRSDRFEYEAEQVVHPHDKNNIDDADHDDGHYDLPTPAEKQQRDAAPATAVKSSSTSRIPPPRAWLLANGLANVGDRQSRKNETAAAPTAAQYPVQPLPPMLSTNSEYANVVAGQQPPPRHYSYKFRQEDTTYSGNTKGNHHYHTPSSKAIQTNVGNNNNYSSNNNNNNYSDNNKTQSSTTEEEEIEPPARRRYAAPPQQQQQQTAENAGDNNNNAARYRYYKRISDDEILEETNHVPVDPEQQQQRNYVVDASAYYTNLPSTTASSAATSPQKKGAAAAPASSAQQYRYSYDYSAAAPHVQNINFPPAASAQTIVRIG